MITIDKLGVAFGARPLFEAASFVVNKKDRIALVGKNGAGKSTLLKILAGINEPSKGIVSVERGISIAYLPQVMVLSDGCTVIEEAEKAFSHIAELEESVEALRKAMEEHADVSSPEYLEIVERFSHESERLQLMGGLNYRAEMERTLIGLGFEAKDFCRPTSEFSGGWRMRIELAKLLLQHPDVLLLDEPTNHLDIESISWLENFLQRSANAVVLVSHDRAFINNVTQRTLDISCGRIYDYKVKYDDYLVLREERREQQLRAFENQQRERAEIIDFVERFRYKPTKAAQVQSRLKQLEKMVPIEVDEVDNRSLHLKFPPCMRSGDFPLMCEGVAKTYGEHNVFRAVDLTLRRGEKVAFVGRNGEGKSTLVKCVMQEIGHEGTLKLGHNVQVGYYAQNQAQLLDENLTVFDTIDLVARGEVRLRINDILGAFMFGGEANEKKVKVLSGGERSRLAMIKLLLEPVNFLILDEPTNHLDLKTKEVLKEAIKAFDGTVIVVSHDRDFLDGLVSKVYEFKNGGVREHIGGIYDYLQSRGMESPGDLAKPKASAALAVEPSEGKLSYEQQKEQAKLLRKAERLVEQEESTVADIEGKIAALEAKIAEQGSSVDNDLFVQHGDLQRQLEAAMLRWEAALEELESLRG